MKTKITLHQATIDMLHNRYTLHYGMPYFIIKNGQVQLPKILTPRTDVVELYVKCELNMIWLYKYNIPGIDYEISLRLATRDDMAYTKKHIRDDCIYYIDGDIPRHLQPHTNMHEIADFLKQDRIYVQQGPGIISNNFNNNLAFAKAQIPQAS
jgi:hypothetical protein